MATRDVTPQARKKFSGKPWTAKFTDITKAAGLEHATVYGGVSSVDYIVEVSGGGLAAIDYDGDGWQDLFVVNGTRFSDVPAGTHHRLYRNLGNGTFVDVSKEAGITQSGWGMSVAAGDYNNDGCDDLFVTHWGHDLLLRNTCKGSFADATAEAGLARKETRWGGGATFLDFDRDGDADLFVSNYAGFDPAKTPKPGANPNCTWKGFSVPCGPRGLPASRHYLYRNDGGKFTDVSEAAGVINATRTFGMTAVAADFDDDGWPDVYVASDSTPSLLFRNLGNGKFAEEALERGIAVNEDGREQAGMGVGLGDYNADGRLDIFKTHFSSDTHVLYRNDGKGMFTDVTTPAGLAVETRYIAWGASMVDFDNDSWPDILFVSGSVYPELEAKLPSSPYKTPALLFRNLGGGAFEPLPPGMAGTDLDAPRASRGSLAFDFDKDGDLDLAIWNRNDPPTLLRNDSSGDANWIQVEAPYGTRATVLLPDGRKLAQEVLSQGSFYSAPGRVLHFGIGPHTAVDLDIRHPAGKAETRRGIKAKTRVRY